MQGWFSVIFEGAFVFQLGKKEKVPFVKGSLSRTLEWKTQRDRIRNIYNRFFGLGLMFPQREELKAEAEDKQ